VEGLLARGMAGFVDSSIPGFVARCSPCDRIGVLAISPPTPPASTPRCRSSARVSASYPSTKTRFSPPRPAHTLPSNLAALPAFRPPALQPSSPREAHGLALDARLPTTPPQALRAWPLDSNRNGLPKRFSRPGYGPFFALQAQACRQRFTCPRATPHIRAAASAQRYARRLEEVRVAVASHPPPPTNVRQL
jgi:hypothetical protein